MEVKYRKPVPYNKKIFGRGKVESETSKFLKINTEILDEYGNVLANAQVKYIKLNVDKITDDTDIHEEMPYLIEDNIKEINFKAL